MKNDHHKFKMTPLFVLLRIIQAIFTHTQKEKEKIARSILEEQMKVVQHINYAIRLVL